MKPAPLTIRRVVTLTARALRLRCPHCGKGRLFSRWTRMRRRCDACGLILERGEEDYFIGAYLVNLIIAEIIVVAAMLVLVVATWPEVPWRLVTWGVALLTIPAAVLTYPFSRSLWLAADLMFRPAEERDFRAEAEVIPLREERPGHDAPPPDPPG
jgi:uncharacterized protein (DUF983 family)